MAEVKVGQVYAAKSTAVTYDGGFQRHATTRTLHVLELVDAGFCGRAYPSARVHCAESGRRSTIAIERFRAMRLVSEAT